jgi:hypothetical protein
MMMVMMMMIIIINRYLLTCRLNSKNAYYKASTKTQIQHKNNTNNTKQTLNKQTKEKYYRKRYIKVLGQNL